VVVAVQWVGTGKYVGTRAYRAKMCVFKRVRKQEAYRRKRPQHIREPGPEEEGRESVLLRVRRKVRPAKHPVRSFQPSVP